MEVHIIRTKDFARLGAEGYFDLAASKAALAKLAASCHDRGISLALVDLRDLQILRKPVFSPDEVEELVDAFREMGFTKEERLAVLYVSDPHHRLRLFTVLGKRRGWHVSAFNDYEKAISWLAAETV